MSVTACSSLYVHFFFAGAYCTAPHAMIPSLIPLVFKVRYKTDKNTTILLKNFSCKAFTSSLNTTLIQLRKINEKKDTITPRV